MSIRESKTAFQLLDVVTDRSRPQLGIQCENCGWSLIDAKSLAAEILLTGIVHECPKDDPWGAAAARAAEPAGAGA